MENLLGLALLLGCGCAVWWATRRTLVAAPGPDRLQEVENRVAELTRRVWQLEHGGTRPMDLEPQRESKEPEPKAVPRPMEVPEPVLEAIVEPEALPEPVGMNWEARLGENWLLKIGALMLVIGVALLPTYSFGLLGPVGRTAMAVALSSMFLTAGILVEGRWEAFRRWAWGLIGVGWAGLYFTAFAAHSIEATRVIDSPALALGVMLAVAVLMVMHSLRYQDERVTGFTFFLAYVSFLLYRDQPIVLPAMGLLAAGALAVSWVHGWRWLIIGDLVLTYSAYALLPGHAGVILGFGDPLLWLLWAMFEAYDLFALKRGRSVPFALHLNAIGFVAASILADAQPEWHYGWFLTWATGAFAVSSLIRWWIAPGEEDPFEDEIMTSGPAASLIAMSLALTGAIFIRFSGLAQTFALLLEGEFLFLMGVRSRQRVLGWLGTGVLGLFALKLLVGDAFALYGTRIAWANLKAWVPLGALGFAVFLGNRILLGGASVLGKVFGVAGSIFFGWLVDALIPREWRAAVYGAAALIATEFAPLDFRYQALASAYAALVFFAVFTLSSSIAIPVGVGLAAAHWWLARRGAWTLAGMTSAAALLCVLVIDKAPDEWQVLCLMALAVAFMMVPQLGMRLQGFAVLWLTTVYYLVHDLDHARVLLGAIPVRLAAGLPLIAAHWVIGYRAAEFPRGYRASQIATTALISVVIAAQFQREWISVTWGAAGAGMLGFGFFSEQRWMRLGGLALFGLGILKLFLYDLSSLTGLARILSFILLGLLLMAASWAYTRFKSVL